MLGPAQLALWVNAAALRMACGKTASQLGVLGSVFTQLGDTLTTMATQKQALEDAASKASDPQKPR